MKRSKLSRHWICWRRFRYQALIAEGVSAPTAWTVAKGETAARQRLTKIVGKKTAHDAELVWFNRDGILRLALMGPLDRLTENQTEKLHGDLAMFIR